MSDPATPFGTSIRVFLADGIVDGGWVVEKSNWTGKALMAPRTRYKDLRARADLDGPGVYLLAGPTESGVPCQRRPNSDPLEERPLHGAAPLVGLEDDRFELGHARLLTSEEAIGTARRERQLCQGYDRALSAPDKAAPAACPGIGTFRVR